MVKADLPLLRLQHGAKRGVKHWYNWLPTVCLAEGLRKALVNIE